jgi:hypothetical protein
MMPAIDLILSKVNFSINKTCNPLQMQIHDQNEQIPNVKSLRVFQISSEPSLRIVPLSFAFLLSVT